MNEVYGECYDCKEKIELEDLECPECNEKEKEEYAHGSIINFINDLIESIKLDIQCHSTIIYDENDPQRERGGSLLILDKNNFIGKSQEEIFWMGAEYGYEDTIISIKCVMDGFGIKTEQIESFKHKA